MMRPRQESKPHWGWNVAGLILGLVIGIIIGLAITHFFGPDITINISDTGKKIWETATATRGAFAFCGFCVAACCSLFGVLGWKGGKKIGKWVAPAKIGYTVFGAVIGFILASILTYFLGPKEGIKRSARILISIVAGLVATIPSGIAGKKIGERINQKTKSPTDVPHRANAGSEKLASRRPHVSRSDHRTHVPDTDDRTYLSMLPDMLGRRFADKHPASSRAGRSSSNPHSQTRTRVAKSLSPSLLSPNIGASTAHPAVDRVSPSVARSSSRGSIHLPPPSIGKGSPGLTASPTYSSDGDDYGTHEPRTTGKLRHDSSASSTPTSQPTSTRSTPAGGHGNHPMSPFSLGGAVASPSPAPPSTRARRQSSPLIAATYGHPVYRGSEFSADLLDLTDSQLTHTHDDASGNEGEGDQSDDDMLRDIYKDPTLYRSHY